MTLLRQNLTQPAFVFRNVTGVTRSMNKISRSTTGTILVTDDNYDVRITTCLMLEKLGWQVLEAADGAEALEILDNRSGIDILLSDVVMPGGRNGYDLARELSQRKNAPRVLLVSGYPDPTGPPGHGDEASDDAVPFLQKPFTMSRLKEALSDLMRDS